jgi:hypothetical protein
MVTVNVRLQTQIGFLLLIDYKHRMSNIECDDPKSYVSGWFLGTFASFETIDIIYENIRISICFAYFDAMLLDGQCIHSFLPVFQAIII